MQLSKSQIRRMRRISLTPLIDVVFLLLIFFMLSSTFLKFTKLAITTGQSSASGKINNDNLVIIRVSEGGHLEINGKVLEKENLIEILNDYKSNGKGNVIIKSQEGALTKDIVQTLENARRSKVDNVMLVK